MKEEYEMRVDYFDPKKMKIEATIVLLGPRRSGKSTLIKDIMYYFRHIPVGTVISKTEKFNHFFDKFIPPKFIYENYNQEIIDKIFLRQTKAINEKWRNPNTFLIMDDCLSDKNVWAKDKRIAELFYNGRHLNILFFLTMQSPQGIPSGYKNNIDYIFLFKPRNENDIDLIYKNYTGVFPDKKTFKQFLDQCTEENHVMVIDNTNMSNKIEERVFIYKARVDHSFKACHPDAWMTEPEPFIRNRSVVKRPQNASSNRKRSLVIKVKK